MAIRIIIDIPERFERPVFFIMLLYRRLRYGYVFRRILLTRGMFAIVDPDDYEYLSAFNWHVVEGGEPYYAVRIGRKSEKRKGKNIWMHRVILNLDDDQICDHINHNGLDNRKCNLRNVTHRQSSMNVRKQFNTSSIYKGVVWYKRCKKWMSQIKVNQKCICLGYYFSEIEAAIAYNNAAKKHFGEYACLNDVKSFEAAERRHYIDACLEFEKNMRDAKNENE